MGLAMTTVHLVYPCAPVIKTPEAIGYNVKEALVAVGYKVVVHRWDALGKIKPEQGDILLGHAHPNPLTVFRRSLAEEGWTKRILMLPFSHDPQQLGFLWDIVPRCDVFLAITGKYWIDTIEQSIFSGWASRMVHLDLAVNQQHFPHIKLRFNEPGARKFLYIGHARFFKNTQYLQEVAERFGADRFATIGCVLDGIRSYGKLDFSKPSAQEILKGYDFLLMTSVSDPNPTTVLEAMSWGLVPVVTPQCGYYNEAGVVNIPLGNTDAVLRILKDLDACSETDLQARVKHNQARLDDHYNWNRFADQVVQACQKLDQPKILTVTERERQAMREGERTSPNYPWRLFNLAMLVKPYMPKRLVRWLSLRLQ